MQKRRPDKGGADLLPGDRLRSTTPSPARQRLRLLANAAMRLRLKALLWAAWWQRGARP